MKPFLKAFLALCASVSALHAAGGELEDRQGVLTETRYHLQRGEFEALDRLRDKYLDLNEKFGSGLPKLGLFYWPMEAFDSQSVDESELNAMEGRALLWRSQNPKSTAAACYLAAIYLDRAWRIRGSGMGNTVSPETFDEVHRLAQKAQKVPRTRRNSP